MEKNGNKMEEDKNKAKEKQRSKIFSKVKSL